MGLNVLVVDDSATMRSMVKRTLEMSGVPIKSFFDASNGREALDKLEEEWVDLVLLDINMPVMNGMEFIDEMMKDPTFNEIPVVVVSTESSDTRINEIEKKGVAFIHKPFTPEAVQKVLIDLIGDLENVDPRGDDNDSF